MDFLEKRAEIKKLMLQLEVLTKGAQERAHQEVGVVVAPEVLQDGLQEVVPEGLQKVVQGDIWVVERNDFKKKSMVSSTKETTLALTDYTLS